MSSAERFPETHWSRLLRLQTEDQPAQREILESVFRQYWRPTLSYIRALAPLSEDDARDLRQDFFTTVIARSALERLSPERGSFRSFLKTSLRNFVISAHRSASARPRLVATATDAAGPTDAAAPSAEELFDREWEIAVLLDAVNRFKQEMHAAGRKQAFDIFESYYLEELSYEDIARRFRVSQDDVRNRLREARVRLRDLLRQTLRSSVGSEGGVQDQLDRLLGK